MAEEESPADGGGAEAPRPDDSEDATRKAMQRLAVDDGGARPWRRRAEDRGLATAAATAKTRRRSARGTVVRETRRRWPRAANRPAPGRARVY